MSHFDYEKSKIITNLDFPFYAIIMAAMRQADTNNNNALHAAFPEVWEELSARYNAPDGYLPGEVPK